MKKRWMALLLALIVLLGAMGMAEGALTEVEEQQTPVPPAWTPAPEAVSELSELPTEAPQATNETASDLSAEESPQSPYADMPTVPPLPTQEPGRLRGVKIGIDPGHQARANGDLEAVAPGSSEKKAKVSSGTSGRYSGVAEHVVNLQVSLQLREALEAEGCEVYMTRESADVDISNQERAIMMNELGVDLVLRIHCNGSTNSSANGIGLYVRKTGTNAEECLRAAEALMPTMLEATGAREDGIFRRDTYTGLNWSEVPSILVEMGFMTNREEDLKLNDPEYQEKLVQGMVEGICAYMGR